MATSEVNIYNLALSAIGNSARVASLTENSVARQNCELFYGLCRDQLLEVFPWPFARKRKVLALLAYAPPTGWGYAYAYPIDCLKVQDIVNPLGRVFRADLKVPFEVCMVGDHKAICSDAEAVEVIYTESVEDPNRFTNLFVDALRFLIGANIAPSMVGANAPAVANQCLQAYNQRISEARASAMSERNADPNPDSEFISVRG
jgi:hypothetical protein